MQAGSSPAALRAALDRHQSVHPDDDVAEVREALERVGRPAKTKVLIDLLRRSDDDKAIVFTRFRATLDHLQGALEEAGFRVAAFHGGLTSEEKDRAMEQFEHHADILVSSEVGGEGRNLQFCRSVINYDLPWNPMQLEQRVGRVHRIGQTREVFVFNFCLAGSLEEYILKVLHEKLNLFELVAGEIEMILGEFEPEQDFAEIVMDLRARASTRDERDSAFDRFADQLIAARGRYQQVFGGGNQQFHTAEAFSGFRASDEGRARRTRSRLTMRSRSSIRFIWRRRIRDGWSTGTDTRPGRSTAIRWKASADGRSKG